MPTPIAFPPPGFDDLSSDEKIDYLALLWDRIKTPTATIDVPEWHREVIAERLRDLESFRTCGSFRTNCGRPRRSARRTLDARLRRRASWERRTVHVYLFSGLTKCGECGAGFIIGSANRLMCFGARDQGTCSNRLTIRRDEVEQRVLHALQEKLLRPDLFEDSARSSRAR
jgi:hypothetical protein